MSVSKRIRFEVFKRDDFSCQYCGRKTPDVVLEVDHVVPRAEGGLDDFENLVTSCWDCNRGKGSVPLENRTALMDLKERTRLLQEREEQIRAYNDVKRLERQRIDAEYAEVLALWCRLWNADELPYFYSPKEAIVRRYLKVLPLEEVLEAAEIAVDRKGRTSAATRYFGGVLRQKLAQRTPE